MVLLDLLMCLCWIGLLSHAVGHEFVVGFGYIVVYASLNAIWDPQNRIICCQSFIKENLP